MSYEAELPGMKVSREQLRIISFRYHFASQFVEGKQVLEVGIADDIKAESIPGDCPNLQYRVLYAVGTR